MRWTRRSWKCMVLIVLVNVVLLVYLGCWQHKQPIHQQQPLAVEPMVNNINHQADITPTLTIVMQDFEFFENSVAEIGNATGSLYMKVNILIISEKFPYPPIKIPNLPNVKLLMLENRPNTVLNDSRPESYINTNYVLFLPDGTTINKNFITKFNDFAKGLNKNERLAYALPVGHGPVKCHGISFLLKTWTLQIGDSMSGSLCGYVTGDHGLLLRTNHLHLLSNPFTPPTFMSMYIQLSLVNIKISISTELYLDRHTHLYQEPHSLWQHKQSYNIKLQRLYARLGIKRVVRENGHTDWYGCSKDSERCFDTVYNDMPEYLYHGRWTPPCCLKALRETAKHVFNILDTCRVRYWLEGGSLLGAARDNDIIPWDYDIDIGIYQDDLIKCSPLARVSQKGFVDDEGFSWEKAIEGDFYRVQYSESNHLHVDIFPFYSRNGIMTKNTWFKTHKQDTEFPETFLKPLTRINFAGLEVSAPNNVKKFLEYKFGKGVIEARKYPNAETVI